MVATRTDVAKLANVSVATVSNVFSQKNYVSPELIEKVKRIAKQLEYVPNHMARCLSLGRSNIIGIILTDYTNPYHMEIVRGIERYATAHGYIVTTLMHEECDDDDSVVTDGLQLDALINFTTNVVSEDFIRKLANSKTVFVDFGEERGLTFSHDYTNAMDDCVKRLVELGHKRIGFLSTIDKLRFAADQRGYLFLDLVKKYKLDFDESCISYCDNFSLSSEKIGYEYGKAFLDRKNGVTAIITTNDMSAFGLYRAAFEKGISIPKDLSVVGFDGIDLMEFSVPRLSTIVFDKNEFGKQMASQIIDCIENNKSGIKIKYTSTTKFVEAESISTAKRND